MSVKTLLNNEKLSLSDMKSMKGVRNFRPHYIHFFQNVFFYSPSRGLQPLASDEKLNKHVFAKQTNDHICSAKNVKTIKD